MVLVYGTFVQTVALSDNGADDGTLVDATSGFQDCGTSTQEVKVDEKGIKFEKDSPAANMTSVSLNLCVQSIMTGGNNGIIAYTDANSVTETNTHTTATLDVGDNIFSLTQATVDEILTTFFTIRVISEGSKNKMGEMEIEYTVPLIDIDGITKDEQDNIVVSVKLTLMVRSGGSAPYTWTTIDTVTSDGTTGVYQFSYEDGGAEYRVFGQNTDGTESDITPEVQGV